MNTSKTSIQRHFYNSHKVKYLEYQRNIPFARYIVKKLLHAIPKPCKTILEVGAGQGRFTLELSKYVQQLTSIDISEVEIDLLREQLRKYKITNTTASVHDLTKIRHTLKRKLFDHIVGIFILHHVPKETLGDIVRQLVCYIHRGSTINFIETNNLSLLHLFAIIIRPDMTWEIEKGAHTNYIDVFIRACESQGLRINVSRKFGFFPPEFINRWPWITTIDSFLEHIPILRDLFCPFIFISAQKT